jgi:hypothetical protein
MPWPWFAVPSLALTTPSDIIPLLSPDGTVVFKKVASQWGVWNSKNFPVEKKNHSK